MKTTSFRLSQKRLEAEDTLFSFAKCHPANREVYDPWPDQLLPKEGAWAMITRHLPAIENLADEVVRPCAVYFLERLRNTDDEGFLPDGRYKVLCRSPRGDVYLWPYEYQVIEVADVLHLWQIGALVFHPTDVEPARFNLQVFYARSRGIGIAEAMAMALGTISAPVGWFEPRPDLAPDLEEIARRVNTSLADHVRQTPR